LRLWAVVPQRQYYPPNCVSYWRGKGEKWRDVDIHFEDILMNIGYAFSALATTRDGKPCLMQEQIFPAILREKERSSLDPDGNIGAR